MKRKLQIFGKILYWALVFRGAWVVASILIWALSGCNASAQPAPIPISPKVVGAGTQIKGAQAQLLSLVAVVPRERTILLVWRDTTNPPGTTWNVYNISPVTHLPILLRTNVAIKWVQLPANQPYEFFDVKALGTNGVESGWSGK